MDNKVPPPPPLGPTCYYRGGRPNLNFPSAGAHLGGRVAMSLILSWKSYCVLFGVAVLLARALTLGVEVAVLLARALTLLFQLAVLLARALT